MSGEGNAGRVALGSWPTPVERMGRLGEQLGLGGDGLWVKRDDLAGPGGGGNKVRKLEFSCTRALQRGATALITTGAAQSNHARLTAAAGARLGLDVVLVLAGAPARNPVPGNLALDGLLGAEVVWAGDVAEEALAARAAAEAERLRSRGAVPEVIPFGGSSVTGALGYVECGRELLAQVPDLGTVVTAVGSGGTMAGLVAALGPERVLGIDCGAFADPAQAVADLVTGLSGHTGPFSPQRLRIDRERVGAGYGVLSDEVMAALTRTARTEGLVLDPVYTGRAMAGLLAAAGSGALEPGTRTVFLHSGGYPDSSGTAKPSRGPWPRCCRAEPRRPRRPLKARRSRDLT